MIARTSRRNQASSWIPRTNIPSSADWIHSHVHGKSELPKQYQVSEKITLVKTENLEFNTDLMHIIDAVRNSRCLLEFADNWDDEGSPGYSEATWSKAVNFLVQNALRLSRDYHVTISAPRILPGPEGSIDIHWRINDREMLVNIPVSDEELVTYYGNDKSGTILKGSLDASARNQWLMMWLAE